MLYNETMILVINVLACCAISFYPYTMFSRPLNAQKNVNHHLYVILSIFSSNIWIH